MPDVVNLKDCLGRFEERWSPRIVAEVNSTDIKVAKLLGEFVWHHHANEDEMFLVLKGELLMRFRDGDKTLGEGDFIVVPRGVEHLPVAREETHVMLIEPRGTLNTGNLRNERTVEARRMDG